MTWKLGSYTIPAGDYPSIESVIPEDQEDIHVEFQPIGASGTDSTLIQYLGTYSKGANGAGAFRLVFPKCTAATRTQLQTLRNARVAWTLEDGDGNTYSVYLKRMETRRAPGMQRTKFRCVVDLLGR